MTKEMYLNLSGIDGRRIQNTFWCSKKSTDKLAVFFTGYRYPSEAPLFHFLKLHFLSIGWGVLVLDYRYNENEVFLNLTDPEQYDYLYDEIKLMQVQLESNLKFDQFCFVAKSLGTTVLYKMLENDFSFAKKDDSQFVWLTPAENNEQICNLIIKDKIPSIYVIGDNDPYYNKDLYLRIEKEISGCSYLVPGAGHIFDYDHDLVITMKNNVSVIEFLMKEIIV